MMAAKKRTKPKPPPVKVKPKKKKQRDFTEGQYVQNVEDPSFIIRVTKDAEKDKQSFEGVVVQADKRVVGEHDMFWLKTRFTVIKNYKE
jgi:collagenase-like PrtC family protease